MSALLTVNGRKIKINRMRENNQIMPLKFLILLWNYLFLLLLLNLMM